MEERDTTKHNAPKDDTSKRVYLAVGGTAYHSCTAKEKAEPTGKESRKVRAPRSSAKAKTKASVLGCTVRSLSTCWDLTRDGCHGRQRVSPFYRTSQLAHSEDFDFLVWVVTGFSDAVDNRADGALSLLRAIKFIIGLDFTVTLSSPNFFLCSFRHHFKTLCRTEMADVKTNTR